MVSFKPINPKKSLVYRVINSIIHINPPCFLLQPWFSMCKSPRRSKAFQGVPRRCRACWITLKVDRLAVKTCAKTPSSVCFRFLVSPWISENPRRSFKMCCFRGILTYGNNGDFMGVICICIYIYVWYIYIYDISIVGYKGYHMYIYIYIYIIMVNYIIHHLYMKVYNGI